MPIFGEVFGLIIGLKFHSSTKIFAGKQKLSIRRYNKI